MPKLAILAILFLTLLISACDSQERDGYQPSQHVKQTTPVWKWKTITAEYKETKGSEIIVYDAEDDMTKELAAQAPCFSYGVSCVT